MSDLSDVIFAPFAFEIPAEKLHLILVTKFNGIKEAAEHFNFSPITIRRKIKNGELQADKVGNQWFVHVEQETHQNEQQVNQADPSALIEQQQSEIEHLREQLARKDEQIESLTQEIDRLTQLLAVSQKSIQQLTQQNQLLLEDKRKPLWRRLFRR